MTQFAVEQDDPPRLGGAFTLADVTGEWVAAQVKANCEKRLALDLLARSVPYYLPMGESVTRSGRKTRVTNIPLFKGYVFVAPPASDASVCFEPHRNRTLKIIPIRDQLGFRREIENVELALVACPRLEPCPFVVTGTEVRIARGPLEGVRGKVIRRGEGTIIVIGVKGFGCATVEIDGRMLEAD